MNFPKVYIIILNYKTWEDTLECVESVMQINYPNYQVIVVDNDSNNGSVEQIKKWSEGELSIDISDNKFIKNIVPKPISASIIDEKKQSTPTPEKLIIIQCHQNKGYSYGNNVGIKHVLGQNDADYVWILNNDVVVESDSLTHLIAEAEKNRKEGEKIGLWGSKIMYYYEPDIIQCAGGAWFNKYTTVGKQVGGDEKDLGQWDVNKIENLGMISGACALASNSFIKDVGLLSEDYFLYFEEMDWAQRAFDKKWELGYCYKSKIYHKEGKTTGGGSKKVISKLSDFYFNRNRLIYSHKFNTLGGIIVTYLYFMLVIANRVKKMQFDRAYMFVKVLFNYKMNYS